MVVQGYVYNADTNELLPGASVQVVDSSYNPTGEGVIADKNGRYYLISDLLEKQGNRLLYSYAGYTSLVLTPDLIPTDDVFNAPLHDNYGNLPEAGVTATATHATAYLGLLLLTGIGFGLLMEKKRSHGKRKNRRLGRHSY